MDISQFRRTKKILKELGLEENNKLTLNELLEIVQDVRETTIRIVPAKISVTQSGLVFQDEEEGYFIFYNLQYTGIDPKYVIAHEIGHILLNHVAKIRLPSQAKNDLLNLLDSNPENHVIYRSLELKRDPNQEQQAELLGSMLAQKILTEEESQLIQALDLWGLNLSQ